MADRTDPNVLLLVAREQKTWEEQQLTTKIDKREGLVQRKTILENKLKDADSIENREVRIAAKAEAIAGEDAGTINAAITDQVTQEQKNEVREARGYDVEIVGKFEIRDQFATGDKEINQKIADKGF